ncbi:CopM family metallochaperone [Mesorhizobium marinum]|uniref:CopM family metallochaperone n=1 Tax=Mesorhizobium marinum TaxID=3228790 RepID=UPI003466A2E7
MRRIVTALSMAALLAAGASIAVAGSDLSPGSKALEEANAAMHHAMAVEMTGDVDVDFMRAMIPHHQGAIDMARIVLEYGKDPETRKLAEEIVKAQESEIAFMNDWLERKAAAGEDNAAGAGHADH